MATSKKKSRSNRSNAKKSTGPKSAVGKGVVAKNAIVHGLCSAMPVVSGEESESDWLTHRKSIVDRVSPEGALERSLAERIALNLWRLVRCARIEVRTINALRERARWESVRAALGYSETDGEGIEEAYRMLEEKVDQVSRVAGLWGLLLDESTECSPITPRDASLKKDTESFFREWLDASQWRTP